MTRTPDFILVGKPETSPKRDCGNCRACCTTMGVPELEKPHHERCRFVRDAPCSGCSIYDQRPGTCRIWECAWLQDETPDDWRPDQIGFVADIRPTMGQEPDGTMKLLFAWNIRLNALNDSWKSEKVLPELLRLSHSDLICIGYAENVIAVIWRGVVKELSSQEQAALNRAGQAEVMPGVVISNDPERKW